MGKSEQLTYFLLFNLVLFQKLNNMMTTVYQLAYYIILD